MLIVLTLLTLMLYCVLIGFLIAAI